MTGEEKRETLEAALRENRLKQKIVRAQYEELHAAAVKAFPLVDALDGAARKDDAGLDSGWRRLVARVHQFVATCMTRRRRRFRQVRVASHLVHGREPPSKSAGRKTVCPAGRNPFIVPCARCVHRCAQGEHQRKTGSPMIFSRSAVLACVVAASASVHAAPIHPLAEQDPTGLFNTNAPSNWSRGWEFQVNAPNVTVTELGLRTPIAGQPFELDLWDVATQTLLRSSTTTSGSTWKFVPITPITLTNGNNYIVSLFATGGQSYYWNNGLPSSWYPTGTIDYVRMKFHNSSTNVFPTHVLSGYQYGIPDIGYTQGTTPVPEPSTLALLGIGAMSILGYGIRKRKRTA